MHTLHYIAVEADSKQEAFDKVLVSLSKEDGYTPADWSDWHVVGGGRWSSAAQKSKDLVDGYSDNSTDVIGYAENKEKFQEIIDSIIKWRSQRMSRNISEIKVDKFISDMVDYASEGDRSENFFGGDTIMNIYAIKETAEMLMGSWTPDSGFYDLVENISVLSYFKERLDKPEQSALQYLVPVDFHF